MVNKENVATGDLDPQSLSGFVTVARSLGYVVSDEHAFLKAEQQRVFAWATEQLGTAG